MSIPILLLAVCVIVIGALRPDAIKWPIIVLATIALLVEILPRLLT
jgi:hypothetical protein